MPKVMENRSCDLFVHPSIERPPARRAVARAKHVVTMAVDGRKSYHLIRITIIMNQDSA